MRYTLSLLTLFLAAMPLAAQVRGDKCGNLRDADVRLEELARYFTDDSEEAFRADLIDQVSEEAARGVVVDEKVCGPLMREVTKKLRDQTNRRDVQQNGYEFSVFHYGPYYAVLLIENSAAETTNLTWATMYIFRVSDGAFLGIGLV